MNDFDFTPRKLLLNDIMSRLNNDKITFVVGVRRSGKSCMAAQLEYALKGDKLFKGNVIRYNFESINFDKIKGKELIEYVCQQCNENYKTYVILDEIIHFDKWEEAVNIFAECPNCKIIIFSSNRRVISDGVNAVREGKYDVVNFLPLSLSEFMEFQHFKEISSPDVPVWEKTYMRFGDKTYGIEDIYKYYITYGGLPILKPEYMDSERAWVVADGSYSAMVTHDILEIGSRFGVSAISDPNLLRCIITIMAKSIGDNISATWIGKQTVEYLKRETPAKTIESYLRAILNANLFYACERYDIKNDQSLKTLAKYYIVDVGLHNYITGIRAEDESRLLENKIYFEFIRRNYEVSNGKIGQNEVNLIAVKGQEKVYVQVMSNKADEPKLLSTLRKIRDFYPKVVIAMGEKTHTVKDGIVVLNAMEFLMGASWRI